MIPSFTDNRGNGSALNKLMTNGYPSSAVVMELACYLKRMSVKAVVEWAPRTANHEADELANGDTTRFDPAKRIDSFSQRCFREVVRWSVRASEPARWLVVCRTGHASRGSESWKTRCVFVTLGSVLRKSPRQMSPPGGPSVLCDPGRQVLFKTQS